MYNSFMTWNAQMPLHTIIEIQMGVTGVQEKRYKLMETQWSKSYELSYCIQAVATRFCKDFLEESIIILIWSYFAVIWASFTHVIHWLWLQVQSMVSSRKKFHYWGSSFRHRQLH